MQHHAIIVIDPDSEHASRLEEELLFMDESNIRIAKPDGWRDCCAGENVGALFLGPGVADNDVHALISEIGEFLPDVPIVLVGDRRIAA